MFDLALLRGGVDPTVWQPHDLATFPVSQLPDARVVWLNRRWWAAQVPDFDQPSKQKAISQALIAEFGVRSARHSQVQGKCLAADRYGASFGSRHGGSGRSALSGRLIAKGIGRTPLAGPETMLFHVDGCLSMAEAIRETVAAEIADAELPWGAVPTVAILATGEPSSRGEAILVRPTFIRPAHFERSRYFGSAGVTGADQQLDEMRVHSMVEAAEHAPDTLNFPGLVPMFERFAEQIGSSHAHRLWQGKFLSSNVTVGGALVDFGSFRSIPSWNRFFGLPDEIFGREGAYLEVAFDSVKSSFRRLGRSVSEENVRAARERLQSRIKQAFGVTVISALGVKPASLATQTRIVSLFHNYFLRQQRRQIQIRDANDNNLPWIHGLLTETGVFSEEEEILISNIAEAVGRDGALRLPTVLSRLANWTCPRPALSYEASTSSLEAAAKLMAAKEDGGAKLLSDLIDNMLAASWRQLDAVPADVKLTGHSASNGTVVSYGVRDHDGQALAIFRAPLDNRVNLKDSRAAYEYTIPAEPSSGKVIIEACPPDALTSGYSVSHNNNKALAPPASFHYPNLSSRWSETG